MKASIALALLIFCEPVSAAENKDYLLWGPFSDEYALRVFQKEAEKKAPDGFTPAVEIVPFKVPDNPGLSGASAGVNPLNVTSDDFLFGDYLHAAGKSQGRIPQIRSDDARWFEDLAQRRICPKYLMIAGHQVISHGWHDHEETRFMFLPTLFETVKTYPAARQILGCVKVAVLFGCNTMTNLEPHRADGGNHDQKEIKALYDADGGGKAKVLGSASLANTLEFYRERLAREYGPANRDGHYEYFRDKSLKVFSFMRKERGKDTPVENLDCLMPDQGLFDGTHRYNYPLIMKQLFPNAALVLGFSSASPDNKPASRILQATFNRARAEVNGTLPQNASSYIENILFPLTDDKAPREIREKIIKAIRKQWSLATFRKNRGRPSGSMTPRYPELDRDGIIPPDAMEIILREAAGSGVPINAPAYGPYVP